MSKPLYVKIRDDLDASLKAFCRAHHQATKTGVVSDALEAFIDREIISDQGLRERYEEIRTGERRASSGGLKVVD